MGQWALAGSGGRRTLFLGLCCELPHSTGTTVALRSAPEPGDGITHSTALGMGTAHTRLLEPFPVFPCPGTAFWTYLSVSIMGDANRETRVVQAFTHPLTQAKYYNFLFLAHLWTLSCGLCYQTWNSLWAAPCHCWVGENNCILTITYCVFPFINSCKLFAFPSVSWYCWPNFNFLSGITQRSFLPITPVIPKLHWTSGALHLDPPDKFLFFSNNF